MPLYGGTKKHMWSLSGIRSTDEANRHIGKQLLQPVDLLPGKVLPFQGQTLEIGQPSQRIRIDELTLGAYGKIPQLGQRCQQGQILKSGPLQIQCMQLLQGCQILQGKIRRCIR